MARRTIEIQPGSSGEDCSLYGDAGSVNTAHPTGNLAIRGSSNKLHFLIRFPLTTIPDGAIIISANLKLYCTSHWAGQKLSIAPCSRAWTEAGATWNKYDGSNSWQTAGGLGANDKGSDFITNQEASLGWNTFALTAAIIKSWKTGTNNGLIGYYSSGGNSNNDDAFSSSDNATASIRPILEVTFDEPGGAFLLNFV
jgi:hypothetical protein